MPKSRCVTVLSALSSAPHQLMQFPPGAHIVPPPFVNSMEYIWLWNIVSELNTPEARLFCLCLVVLGCSKQKTNKQKLFLKFKSIQNNNITSSCCVDTSGQDRTLTVELKHKHILNFVATVKRPIKFWCPFPVRFRGMAGLKNIKKIIETKITL